MAERLSYWQYLRQWWRAAFAPAWDAFGWIGVVVGGLLWAWNKWWSQSLKSLLGRFGLSIEGAMSDLVWVIPLTVGLLILAWRLLRAPYELQQATVAQCRAVSDGLVLERDKAVRLLEEARTPRVQIFRHKEAHKRNDAIFQTILDHFQKTGWQVEGCGTDLPQHENGIRIAGKSGYQREMAVWGLKSLGVEWIADERPNQPEQLQVIVGRYQTHGHESKGGIDLQVSEMKFSWAENADLPEGVLVVLDVERLVNKNTDDAVVDVKLVVPLWRPGALMTISTNTRPLTMRPEQIKGHLPQFPPLVNLPRKQGIGPGFFAFFFGYDSYKKDIFLPDKQRADTLEEFAKRIYESEIVIEVTDRANAGYQVTIPAPGTLQKRVDRMARAQAAGMATHRDGSAGFS